MHRLLGVAFAILLALELAVLTTAVWLLLHSFPLLWASSPWRAVVAVLGLFVIGAVIWKTHRAGAVSVEVPASGPQITFSRIPVTGVPGALFMLQFLVWALLIPAVGLFYTALLAGAFLLLPVIFFVNRPGQGGASAVGLGGLVGALAGIGAAAVIAFRQVPLAGLFLLAFIAGLAGAPVLIWLRSPPRHPSIAVYNRTED